MTFGDQCSDKGSNLFWKLIVWFIGRFTLVVSNSPQVSFYLVSGGYHIRNCKHLPPVSSFFESVEGADLLNQGTVFPEPTYIPAQQMRLGFCHGHYINFKRITAMPTFRLFHFCGRRRNLSSTVILPLPIWVRGNSIQALIPSISSLLKASRYD